MILEIICLNHIWHLISISWLSGRAENSRCVEGIMISIVKEIKWRRGNDLLCTLSRGEEKLTARHAKSVLSLVFLITERKSVCTNEDKLYI